MYDSTWCNSRKDCAFCIAVSATLSFLPLQKFQNWYMYLVQSEWQLTVCSALTKLSLGMHGHPRLTVEWGWWWLLLCRQHGDGSKLGHQPFDELSQQDAKVRCNSTVDREVCQDAQTELYALHKKFSAILPSWFNIYLLSHLPSCSTMLPKGKGKG